jgi:hypothetical protein
MTPSGDDKAEARAAVERMIAEYRFKPTQEVEDRLGVEIAALPAAQREQVPAVLLEIVAEEAAAGRA